MTIVEKIKLARDKLSGARERQAQLVGRRDGLLKQLKDEFDCDNVDQATERLKKMDSEAVEKEAVLSALTVDLDKLLADMS